MSDKKNGYPYNEEAHRPLWDNDDIRVASATECTGLIPTPATTDNEIESYSNIYDVPLTRTPLDYLKDNHSR